MCLKCLFLKSIHIFKSLTSYLPCTHVSIRKKEQQNERLAQAVDTIFALHHIPFRAKSLKFVKSVEV